MPLFTLNKFFITLLLLNVLFIIHMFITLFLFNNICTLINLIDKLIFTGFILILIRNRLNYTRLYLCFLSALTNVLLVCILLIYYNYKEDFFDYICEANLIIIFMYLIKVDSEPILPITNIYKK
jgi:hypothetical protein